MSDSDGKVRIIIEVNAKEVLKDMDSVNKAFDKNVDTIKKATSATSGYEKVVQENTRLLRELAFGGNQNTEGFKRLAEQTREYKKALEDANATVQKAVNTSNENNTVSDKLGGTIKRLAGAYIGIQGIRLIYGKIIECTEAFREQDRAVKQLNLTLQNAGVYSQAYSAQIQRLASEIQSYSNYGDEAIIKAQALGQAYVGNLKITKELTQAVVDFAAATGMDLEQAFTLVGKSIGSSTNALGRYGIELKQGMSDNEKMIAIQRQLAERYEGSAKSMADASVQLKNALGDLGEEIGDFFNPMIKSCEKALLDATNAMTAWLKKTNEARKANSINALETSLAYQQEQLKKATGAEKKLWEQRIAKTQEWLNAQKNALNKPADSTNKVGRKYSDEIGFGGTSTANVAKAKDAYEKLQEAVSKARREIELAAMAHGTSSQQVQQAFTKYQEFNKKLQEINKLFEGQKQKIDDSKGAYQLLNEKIADLNTKLRDLATLQQIGSEQWNNYKVELQAAQAEYDAVNKALADNGIKVEDVSKKISSSLSTNLINALQNGGNAFEMFSNIAINALQKILDKILEISVVTPILNALTGGLGGGFGSVLSLFGFKDGAVFKNSNVTPFANGGIATQPTLFSMNNGKTGLMGEAGAEAVMPLRRMSNGKLGVEAQTGDNKQVVNIYNYSGADVQTQQRSDGSMDVIIKRVNEALMNERTSSGFRVASQRESSRGVQAA